MSEAIAEARKNKLTTLPLCIAIAEAAAKTKAVSIEDASNLILENGLDGRGVDVDSCRSALVVLKRFDGESGAKTAQKWVEAVKSRFPLASDFS